MLILLFSAICISCKNNKKEKKQENIFEQSQNFFSVQGKDTSLVKNILIVVIDPHADGKKAALLFEDVANKYNCTVIGLTDVENNQTDFLDRINKNINGAVSKLNLNVKQLYFAGFSGGARMAYSYYMTYPQIVNGILMCGAGLPQNANVNIPVSLIIGTKDPNFSEQYSSPYSPELFKMNQLNLVFEGIHEWPDKKFLNLGMSFLLSKNPSANYVKNTAFINSAIDELKNTTDKYVYFKALEAGFKISNGETQKKFKAKIDSLIEDENFKKFTTALTESLNSEIQRNQMYYNLFPSKDINWWKTEISKINTKTKSKNVLEANSFYRTKGFLGLVIYSLTAKEIQNPQSTMIDKYLQIYELLEPQNQDMLHFKEIRKNQL